MDQDDRNPCDLCKKNGFCGEEFCALAVRAARNECTQHLCFLNYEGSCLIGLYENCGAWEA